MDIFYIFAFLSFSVRVTLVLFRFGNITYLGPGGEPHNDKTMNNEIIDPNVIYFVLGMIEGCSAGPFWVDKIVF